MMKAVFAAVVLAWSTAAHCQGMPPLPKSVQEVTRQQCSLLSTAQLWYLLCDTAQKAGVPPSEVSSWSMGWQAGEWPFLIALIAKPQHFAQLVSGLIAVTGDPQRINLETGDVRCHFRVPEVKTGASEADLAGLFDKPGMELFQRSLAQYALGYGPGLSIVVSSSGDVLRDDIFALAKKYPPK